MFNQEAEAKGDDFIALTTSRYNELDKLEITDEVSQQQLEVASNEDKTSLNFAKKSSGLPKSGSRISSLKSDGDSDGLASRNAKKKQSAHSKSGSVHSKSGSVHSKSGSQKSGRKSKGRTSKKVVKQRSARSKSGSHKFDGESDGAASNKNPKQRSARSKSGSQKSERDSDGIGLLKKSAKRSGRSKSGSALKSVEDSDELAVIRGVQAVDSSESSGGLQSNVDLNSNHADSSEDTSSSSDSSSSSSSSSDDDTRSSSSSTSTTSSSDSSSDSRSSKSTNATSASSGDTKSTASSSNLTRSSKQDGDSSSEESTSTSESESSSSDDSSSDSEEKSDSDDEETKSASGDKKSGDEEKKSEKGRRGKKRSKKVLKQEHGSELVKQSQDQQEIDVTKTAASIDNEIEILPIDTGSATDSDDREMIIKYFQPSDEEGITKDSSRAAEAVGEEYELTMNKLDRTLEKSMRKTTEFTDSKYKSSDDASLLDVD